MGEIMSRFTFRAYLSDKKVEVIALSAVFFTTLGFCGAFRLRLEIMIVLVLPILLVAVVLFWRDYYRRRRFYEDLRMNLEKLDQAYLLTETISRPDFLDGKILHDTCYEIDKSMLENISKSVQANQDFREYIELWIHEIKNPLMALELLVGQDNRPELERELARVDSLAEQVLYFVRAESAEKDYSLRKCNISEVVQAVLLNYRTLFQLQGIEIVAGELNQDIYSDAKWLQFMIGQILANALKYGAKTISFQVERGQKVKILKIRDDGIGVPKEDLPRVFDKTFTGQNGRKNSGVQSTGMGLYLVKTLTDKLGHQVQARSETGKNSYTEIAISFGEHDYYKNVR